MTFGGLYQAVEKALNGRIISCMAINVVKDGETLHSSYSGTVSLDDPVRIDQGTHFDLASLTKPLATALLAGMMMEEGAFGIETRIGDIYDEYSLSFNQALRDVTIGSLLSHSSGLDAWYELYSILKSKSDAYMFVRSRSPVYTFIQTWATYFWER